jgi:hypothetical protein
MRYQNLPYTPETINQILIERGSSIRQLEQHKNKDSRVLFMCVDCNSEFYSSWSNVRDGHGCQICADRNLSLDKINERLKANNKNIVCLSVRRWDDATFKCLTCNHIRNAVVSNVLKPGRTSCPKCATSGFSMGRPGWFYIARRKDGLYKFGITNNLEQRMGQHKKNKFKLVYCRKEAGENVQRIEKIWKGLQLNWYSGIPFDGYTESFWMLCQNKS